MLVFTKLTLFTQVLLGKELVGGPAGVVKHFHEVVCLDFLLVVVKALSAPHY